MLPFVMFKTGPSLGFLTNSPLKEKITKINKVGFQKLDMSGF